MVMNSDPQFDFSGMNLNQRLLRERIVFLGSQVDQDSSNRICAELLLLEAQDPTADIAFYINSPGGSVTDLSLIHI